MYGVCQEDPPGSNRCCQTVILINIKFKGSPFDFRELDIRHGKPIGLFVHGCPMFIDRSECGVDDADSHRTKKVKKKCPIKRKT